MKELYCVRLRESLSLEEAWEAFEMAGIELAYGSEEEGKVDLYVYVDCAQDLSLLPWIEMCQKQSLPAIDWEAQWAAHGLDFHDGAVHVSFEPFGRQAMGIQLQPGPGFGDLSHPTTHLVVRLMARFLNGQPVIDIGCGSGILSLAAVAMGSSVAYGLDIDPAAVEHALQNAQLNGMEDCCHFSLPDQLQLTHLDRPPLVVMNMISSEQEMAWQSLPALHYLPKLCLTSGIRKEERERYVQQTAQWGWQLKEEVEEQGWLGFCFANEKAQ